MLCKDIMKAKPECAGPAVPVFEAARRMREANIGFLPVCDASGAVIGTVTDRDIAVRVVADQLSATTPLERVMTPEVVACSADDEIDRARELMEDHRKSRIMCLDEEGHLAGIISLSDLAQFRDASGTLRQVTQREAHA